MTHAPARLLLMLLPLTWLASMTGCAHTSPLADLPPAPAPQVQLPALPAEAQPAPLPTWCLETGATSCSMRLRQLFEHWLQPSTTPPAAQPPAPPPTTPRASG